MLQTFCEGPNNGGHSLAEFLAGSTPMAISALWQLASDVSELIQVNRIVCWHHRQNVGSKNFTIL